jgi:hypothetical protein
MSDIEFSILFTPPLVITADGDFKKEVFYKKLPFSHKLKREWRSENARDEKRSQEFQTKEWIAYTFTIPKVIIKKACEDIANEVFNNDNFLKAIERDDSSRVFVEGKYKATSISLIQINPHDFAEQIQKIIE